LFSPERNIYELKQHLLWAWLEFRVVTNSANLRPKASDKISSTSNRFINGEDQLSVMPKGFGTLILKIADSPGLTSLYCFID